MKYSVSILLFLLTALSYSKGETKNETIDSFIDRCPPLASALENDNKGKIKESIARYIDSLECFEKNDMVQRKINLRIGVYYNFIEKYDEAIHFLNKSIDYNKSDDITLTSLKTIGDSYFEKNDYEAAKKHYKIISELYENKSEEVADSLLNLAMINYHQENFKEAEVITKKLEEEYKEFPTITSASNRFMQMNGLRDIKSVVVSLESLPKDEKLLVSNKIGHIGKFYQLEPITECKKETNCVIHMVKNGETLWFISKMHYKSGLMWPLIYTANSQKIGQAGLIHPNQKLAIYTDLSEKDIISTWAHAKKYGNEFLFGSIETSPP